MKKAWKNTTMAALMLTLALGSGGAAFAQTTDGQQSDKVEMKVVEAVKTTEAKAAGMMSIAPAMGMGLLSNPVHEQQYIKMLVKAYAPETEQQWTDAIQERKQVEQKLTKPMMLIKMAAAKDGQSSDEAQAITDAVKMEAVFAVPAEKLEAAKEGAAEGGQDQPAKTVIAKRVILPNKSEAANVIMTKDMNVLTAGLKLQNDIAQAVEAGDGAQMKELLPQLLEQYKEQTAQLKKISEAQTALPSSTDNKDQ